VWPWVLETGKKNKQQLCPADLVQPKCNGPAGRFALAGFQKDCGNQGLNRTPDFSGLNSLFPFGKSQAAAPAVRPVPFGK